MFTKGWRDEELSACSELISFGKLLPLLLAKQNFNRVVITAAVMITTMTLEITMMLNRKCGGKQQWSVFEDVSIDYSGAPSGAFLHYDAVPLFQISAVPSDSIFMSLWYTLFLDPLFVLTHFFAFLLAKNCVLAFWLPFVEGTSCYDTRLCYSTYVPFTNDKLGFNTTKMSTTNWFI